MRLRACRADGSNRTKIVPAQTALVIVDLQNGYASLGGYRSLIGQDVGPARKVIENSLRLLDAARSAGLTVIVLKNGWDVELKSAFHPPMNAAGRGLPHLTGSASARQSNAGRKRPHLNISPGTLIWKAETAQNCMTPWNWGLALPLWTKADINVTPRNVRL
jgi:Isochorismatase family